MIRFHSFVRKATRLGLALFLAATISHAFAQEQEPVAVTLSSSKIVIGDGKEKLASAAQSKPGDMLEYDALYTNQSARNITNLLATIPIPEGLEFADSVQPSKAEGSLDGKTFSTLPLVRKVTAPDGKVVTEEVPYREVRAVRWTIDTLTPGQKIKVSLRARVLSNAPAK